MEGCRAKLARADEHLDLLREEINRAFVKQNAKGPPIHINSPRSSDESVITYDVECEPFPELYSLRLATICGDFIQNLRASLDYVACALVESAQQKPSPQAAFPIVTLESDFIGHVKFRKKKPEKSPLYGLDVMGEPFAIIESAQPYQRRDPDGPWRHPLLLLSKLSNRDKHHTLTVTLGQPDIDSVNHLIGWNSDAQLLASSANPMPVSHERRTHLMRLIFSAGVDSGVHVKGTLVLHPMFGYQDHDPSTGSTDSVFANIDGLTWLRDYVIVIVEKLGQHL
jgi:hypothetical protein